MGLKVRNGWENAQIAAHGIPLPKNPKIAIRRRLTPARGLGSGGLKVITLNDASIQEEAVSRVSTTLGELDRVLGGGVVQGSFTCSWRRSRHPENPH